MKKLALLILLLILFAYSPLIASGNLEPPGQDIDANSQTPLLH
jgi:hypothetical protein